MDARHLGGLVRIAALAVVAVLAARDARAQAPSGSTLSPDARSFLVNKDLGNERWTINVNLFGSSPADIINVTGNIFRADGGPASFVTCLVRNDSTGTLTDPDSTFRLSCSGSDACTTTAEDCARDAWTPIADDVPVPASFFLPPGGLGAFLFPASVSSAEALARAGWSPPRAPAVERGLAERLAAWASRAWGGFRTWVVKQRDADFLEPRNAWAGGGTSRGATLTLDRYNFLVTKDVGAERWSISYSLTPTISDEGLVVDRFLSVTGNVYQPDGSPPSFVYCTQRADSTGTLSDPTSEFRFSCSGASACASNASECAETGWSLISDDIPLQASFFLPVGGLPATPASDPEIVIIGRTSDPPSIVVPIDASSLTAPDAAGPAGTCNTGAECILPILGSCLDVTGSVVELESGGCGCAVQDPDPSCIGCGGGATGQCGGDCAFPVAGATARGTCLPFDYESEECACYAITAGGDQTVQGCGGVIGVSCPDAGCCANDPRGSCDLLGGLVDCPGVCVAGGAGCSSGG